MVTLIVLVIGFVILMFLPDEEEEDKTFLSSGGGGKLNTVTSENKDIAPALLENGAVREKQVHLKGDGTDTVTVMIYMNGSDLESDDQEATTDLTEMIRAGSSDQVHVVVQTMGTKSWSKKYKIASNRSQRYEITDGGLKLLQDDLGQLDCTTSQTLGDFVKWSAATYPADRYILMFWDHGGGPVYGFGYDQWNDDEYACLSVDEMQEGLRNAGVYFDFIGMDCCIMSTLETCCALYDYCDYMILSEDFESGLGWSYTGWLKELYRNPSISTVTLGKKICDDFIKANETESDGDESILALIDQSMMKVLYNSWVNFAYANEKELLNANYSRTVSPKGRGRVLPALSRGFGDWWNFGFSEEEDYSLSDYYITDIMAVAQNIQSDESDMLQSALAQTLVYVGTTAGDADLTGIAVTLPYSDSNFYSEMAAVFRNIGMDTEYVSWLKNFTGVSGSSSDSYYDNKDYDWDGWEEYEDEYDWEDSSLLDLILNELFSDDEDWDDWDYEDSYNNWYDDDDWDYDEDDGSYYYEGDDWYWDDWDYYEEDDYHHGGYHDGYYGGHGGGGSFLDWLFFW